MIRPFFPERTNHMRELDPEDIDQLITVSGMVIRTSGIIPEMRQALFQCVVCGHVETVEVDRGRISEPIVCQRCQTNHSFSLIHNRSLFDDKQIVKMQVTYSNISEFSLSFEVSQNSTVFALSHYIPASLVVLMSTDPPPPPPSSIIGFIMVKLMGKSPFFLIRRRMLEV